ncbi:hypothetical protein EVA_14069 [gut metagenome]|uniref:Uncharacterized protein n=1 Tax=gut metagenome TaxID=749906 RepID=J9GEN7_9ZZZZ
MTILTSYLPIFLRKSCSLSALAKSVWKIPLQQNIFHTS